MFTTIVLPGKSWRAGPLTHRQRMDRSLSRWGRHLLGLLLVSPSAGVLVEFNAKWFCASLLFSRSWVARPSPSAAIVHVACLVLGPTTCGNCNLPFLRLVSIPELLSTTPVVGSTPTFALVTLCVACTSRRVFFQLNNGPNAAICSRYSSSVHSRFWVQPRVGHDLFPGGPSARHCGNSPTCCFCHLKHHVLRFQRQRLQMSLVWLLQTRVV